MATTIHMRCGGCDAEKETAPIRRTFHSFNGSSHGFGRYQQPSIDEAVEPTGWVWSDIIGCTYCPACWAKIEEDAA